MIDIRFDFTTDSPGYWDGFWERNAGLGAGGSDPDNASPTLQKYHKELWSKPLPNGEVMDLRAGKLGKISGLAATQLLPPSDTRNISI